MTNQQETSQDKGMIIVPLRVLEKIDRNKDRLSRAEFVELCIDTLLEQGEALSRLREQTEGVTIAERPQSEEAVSRKEFEEFRKGMKKLQRAYMDLLLGLIVDPMTKASSEEQGHFRERVAEILEGWDGKQGKGFSG